MLVSSAIEAVYASHVTVGWALAWMKQYVFAHLHYSTVQYMATIIQLKYCSSSSSSSSSGGSSSSSSSSSSSNSSIISYSSCDLLPTHHLRVIRVTQLQFTTTFERAFTTIISIGRHELKSIIFQPQITVCN